MTLRRRDLVGLAACLTGTVGSAQNTPLSAAIMDIPPYGFVDKSGNAAGILVEWFRELATSSGVEIRTEITPLARVAHLISEGQADVAVFVGSTFAWKSKMVSIGHVGTVLMSVWSSRPASIKSPADLAGKRIAVVRGGSTEQIARHWPGVAVDAVSNIQSMASMLKRGRVDAFLIPDPTLRLFLSANPSMKLEDFSKMVFEFQVPLDLYANERIGGLTTRKLAMAAIYLANNSRFEALFDFYMKANELH